MYDKTIQFYTVTRLLLQIQYDYPHDYFLINNMFLVFQQFHLSTNIFFVIMQINCTFNINNANFHSHSILFGLVKTIIF